MAIVLAATGLFVCLHMSADLDSAIDRSLRARAADVRALVAQADTGLRDAGSGADFAQILTAGGRVFDAGAGLGRRPLLSPAQVRSVRAPVYLRLPGARLLATPVHAQDRRLVVVVGASLAERDRALVDLRRLLLLGGPIALLLASLAGYGLAAAALHPVESLRRRAASISTAQLHRRLPLSPGRDELRRLGQTLNTMLDRLQAGLAHERAFTADASHELRTPLTMLRTELELIGRDRPIGARLDGAVAAAVDEAERMTRLIDDLLALARADEDEDAFRRREVPVSELTRTVAARSGRPVAIDAPDGLIVQADRARLEQALGNMLDNAFRHGAEPVTLTAALHDGDVELHVRDAGSGFPPAFLPNAFERFSRADRARGAGGTGLGLAIVDAVARGHGGAAHVANLPAGGTDVWIVISARSGRAAGRVSRRGTRAAPG